jgi:DNA-binding PadR family transcriptional regulator
VTGPLCPAVLAMLAARPRRAYEVAARLPAGYAAADETLERLRAGRLVRVRRGCSREPLFMITARGRRELALQRLLAMLTTQS